MKCVSFSVTIRIVKQRKSLIEPEVCPNRPSISPKAAAAVYTLHSCIILLSFFKRWQNCFCSNFRMFPLRTAIANNFHPFKFNSVVLAIRTVVDMLLTDFIYNHCISSHKKERQPLLGLPFYSHFLYVKKIILFRYGTLGVFNH